MKNQENLNHYSSKVKGVFVELKNYSFYHRPTDLDNPDRRFIGRKKVLQKIKAILTNSEVKSGAYLLTGFRGMGKTSVVNRVIEELKGAKTYNPRLSRYIRIITAVFFFSAFNVSQVFINIFGDGKFSNLENWVLLYIPLFVLLCCGNIVIYRNKNLRNLFKDIGLENKTEYTHYIKRLFIFKLETRSTSNIYYLIAHDYIIASFIHILAFIFIFSAEWSSELIDSHLYSFKFVRYFLSTIIVFSILAILNYKDTTSEDNKKLNFRAIITHISILIILLINIKIDCKLVSYFWEFIRYLSCLIIVISFLTSLKVKKKNEHKDKLKKTILSDLKNHLKKIKQYIVKLSFIKKIAFVVWCILLIVFIYFQFILAFKVAYLLLSVAILLNWFAISDKVYSFINYSHYVSIKINLGQEKLKEKDILKLVAKSIFEEYKRLIQSFSTPRRFWWRFLSGLLFYLFVLTIYHYRPTYSMMSEIRDDLALGAYFPSQKIFSSRYMPIDYRLDRLVVEEMELKEKINNEFGYQDYSNIIKDFRNVDLVNQLYQKEFADQNTLEIYTQSLTNHLRTYDRYPIIAKLLLEENLPFSKYQIDSTWTNDSIYITLTDSIQQKKLLRTSSKVRIKNEVKRILAGNEYSKKEGAYSDIIIDNTYGNNIYIHIEGISKDASLRNDLIKHLLYVKGYSEWYNEILEHSIPNDFTQNQISNTEELRDRILNEIDSSKIRSDNIEKLINDTLKTILTTETTKNAQDSVLQTLIKDEALIGVETNLNWLKAITIRIDYFVYTLYSDFSHFLFEAGGHIQENDFNKRKNRIEKGIEQNFFNSTLDLEPNFHFLPPRLDYLFFIFLFIFWIFLQIIGRSSVFGVNHYQVLKELENLIDSIDASVFLGADNSIGTKKTYPFYRGFTRNRIYPLANEREIETKLIQILNLSEQIPIIRMRPKFIFIFDELDKIEPTGTYSENSEEDLDSYVTEGTRKRQQTIGRILSNLKHFFNTAKAKFIFIAGREMYDAAIADISDRDSLIGSLFHEVIYINSFFKDPSDDKLSDITSMTERYVCQFILPANHPDTSLKGYRTYLEEKVLIESEYTDKKNYYRMVGKIIFTLQNFITYLTYRSNGSPKKITKIFEEHIYSFKERQKEEKALEGLYVGKNYRNLYLRFTFYDQYIFGFSSFLFNPFGVILIGRGKNIS